MIVASISTISTSSASLNCALSACDDAGLGLSLRAGSMELASECEEGLKINRHIRGS